MLKSEKRRLRTVANERGGNFSESMKTSADQEICRLLSELPELEGQNVVAFAADGFEPDITDFLRKRIAAGLKVGLPRSNPDTHSGYEMVQIDDFATELEPGAYGIHEPIRGLPVIAPEEYDRYVWLVPGVAFDASGVRLGRGKGVYDRLLHEQESTLVIGIFYEYRKLESIPLDTHDRRLDMAVTEEKVYWFA